MSDWERWALLLLLGPVFWLQGRYVRRITPRLPDPPGDRQGVHGHGPPLRLLVAGDSAAAGVGAACQDEALCGQLVRNLGQRRKVVWQLRAAIGLDSPGLLQLLQDTPASPCDVVVLCVGVNDVTALTSPHQWLALQDRLAEVVALRFRPGLVLHAAVPPMDRFSALPQPLRWFFGGWARQMNRLLQARLAGHGQRFMHPFPVLDAAQGLAVDGFHPGPQAYAAWAQDLSRRILAAAGVDGPVQLR